MDNQNQQLPASGKNKKTLWTIVAIVAIFIYIVYMFDKYGSDDSSPISTPPAVQKEVKDVSATNQQQEAKKESNLSVAFDVPSLIGKSYTQLKTELGEPSREFIPNDKLKEIGETSWDATWNKSGVDFAVSYFDADKPINYLFVSNADKDGVSNKEQLMKLCNLENVSDLKIIPQEAIGNKSQITGISICNKNYSGEKYIYGSEKCK